MDLSKFIYQKDEVFTREYCEKFIKLFEKKENEGIVQSGQMAGGLDKKIKNSKELNLFDYPEHLNNDFFFNELNNQLSNYFLGNLPFRNYFDPTIKLFTQKCRYQVCQIQKYIKGEGHYESYHVEVENSYTSSRIFSMIIYLNDVLDGGETSFLYSEQKIKPETGKVVIFPSAFPFVHCGLIPKSNHKYIISTWLTYDP